MGFVVVVRNDRAVAVYEVYKHVGVDGNGDSTDQRADCRQHDAPIEAFEMRVQNSGNTNPEHDGGAVDRYDDRNGGYGESHINKGLRHGDHEPGHGEPLEGITGNGEGFAQLGCHQQAEEQHESGGAVGDGACDQPPCQPGLLIDSGTDKERACTESERRKRGKDIAFLAPRNKARRTKPLVGQGIGRLSAPQYAYQALPQDHHVERQQGRDQDQYNADRLQHGQHLTEQQNRQQQGDKDAQLLNRTNKHGTHGLGSPVVAIAAADKMQNPRETEQHYLLRRNRLDCLRTPRNEDPQPADDSAHRQSYHHGLRHGARHNTASQSSIVERKCESRSQGEACRENQCRIPDQAAEAPCRSSAQMRSSSTSPEPGREATPIAVRACAPSSPNTATSSSEAPSRTLLCWPNPAPLIT